MNLCFSSPYFRLIFPFKISRSNSKTLFLLKQYKQKWLKGAAYNSSVAPQQKGRVYPKQSSATSLGPAIQSVLREMYFREKLDSTNRKPVPLAINRKQIKKSNKSVTLLNLAPVGLTRWLGLETWQPEFKPQSPHLGGKTGSTNCPLTST